MPKRPHGLFHSLSRLRARARRINAELTRLGAIARDKEIKLQLREARDLLLEAEDMMTPGPEHEDQLLRGLAPSPPPAAASA